MGKHKDPEVADQSGQADTASGETASSDTGSHGAASGDAASGAAGGDTPSAARRGRKASGKDKETAAAGKDASGGAGAPGRSGPTATEEASTGSEETSTETAGPEDEHTKQDAPAGEHEHHDEPAYHDEAMSDLADQIAEERSHRTVYATMFYVLLGIIAVAGLTLWAAPKVAPHVPGFIAQYLVPGQVQTAGRVDALEKRLAEQADSTKSEVAALRKRLDDLSAKVDAAAPSKETQAAIQAAQQAADSAGKDAAALADRVSGLETRLGGLREEVNAVSQTLTGGGKGAAPAELAAAVNSLRSRVDKLASAVEGGPSTAELADRIKSLQARIDELEGSLADAQKTGTEVSSAIREARLQSAFDTLAGRISAGQPYKAALAEITGVAGAEAPDALAAHAETGVASASELEATFGRHAQAAISASIRAQSGQGTVGEALGWLRAQVAGRPVVEQQGDSVPAITSRIAARLEEGRPKAALAEAESLPAPAKEALDGWLERLRASVAAEQALADWREQIAAKG